MVDMVSFRAGPLDGLIEARMRGDLKAGAVAQRDLTRYYDALALALSQVQLTINEAMLIIDALNGSFIDLNLAQLLHYEIEDSFGDGLAEKWQIDGPALLGKVRDWSLLQRIAVVDAVERWWGDAYHIDDGAARLLRVGLTKPQV